MMAPPMASKHMSSKTPVIRNLKKPIERSFRAKPISPISDCFASERSNVSRTIIKRRERSRESTANTLSCTMGRGKSLSERERTEIRVLHEEGYNQSEIARRVGRSRKSVTNVISNLSADHAGRRRGAIRKLSPKLTRAIIRRARTGNYTARELANFYNVDVSVRRIQQILCAASFLQWKKCLRAPKLSPLHKVARVEWARYHLHRNPKMWRNVIWSAEKKFDLDGPDGISHYWADSRLPRKVLSSRQNGGGSLMIWGAFSWRGCAKLAIIKGNMNSEQYIEVLQEYMLPFAEDKHPDGFIFQQDGASVHRSQATMQYLKDADVDLLDWPARSPDLNPIENLWGLLVRRVYHNRRQFDCVSDLEEAILYEWEKITEEEIRALITSLPRRCMDVIEKRGAETKY